MVGGAAGRAKEAREDGAGLVEAATRDRHVGDAAELHVGRTQLIVDVERVAALRQRLVRPLEVSDIVERGHPVVAHEEVDRTAEDLLAHGRLERSTRDGAIEELGRLFDATRLREPERAVSDEQAPRRVVDGLDALGELEAAFGPAHDSPRHRVLKCGPERDARVAARPGVAVEGIGGVEGACAASDLDGRARTHNSLSGSASRGGSSSTDVTLMSASCIAVRSSNEAHAGACSGARKLQSVTAWPEQEHGVERRSAGWRERGARRPNRARGASASRASSSR